MPKPYLSTLPLIPHLYLSTALPFLTGHLSPYDQSILQALFPRNLPQSLESTVIENVRIRLQGTERHVINLQFAFSSFLLLYVMCNLKLKSILCYRDP